MNPCQLSLGLPRGVALPDRVALRVERELTAGNGGVERALADPAAARERALRGGRPGRPRRDFSFGIKNKRKEKQSSDRQGQEQADRFRYN